MEELNLSDLIKISILDSGLSAMITIESDKELNGPLPYDKVLDLLREKNITYGINYDLLKNICEKPNQWIGSELEIARGYLPINGENGSIEWKVKLKSRSQPAILEHGNVDFYNLDKIINLRKGDLIAVRTPAGEGIAGKNINDKEIPAKKGKDVQFKTGKNVILNPCKDKLYAGIDGHFVITDNEKVNIFPIYEVVGDVDFGIGNIDFVGTVIVKGNVPDGFKIRAGGEIKIYGNVESSELYAGEDIFIQQGIIGHNKSYIETEKSITASFILDANVKAKEDITVLKSIMHSNISAGRKVTCQSDKGIIVGGEIHAGNSVIASTLGNEHTTLTVIEVGISPELKEEIRSIHKEKLELDILFDKIEKGLTLFEKMEENNQVLPPERQKMKTEFLNQRLVINNRLEEIKARELDLEEIINQVNNACIEVKKVVFPGVKIVIGKTVKFIKEEIKYARFVLEDGEIKTKK
ncbi:MAG: DUF342 domain-containing protein [Vulcanibacillus sp.]